MSEPIDDGGTAFPWEDTKDTAGLPRPNHGMSLRDYFAAKASEGDIAEHMPPTIGDCQKFEKTEGFWPTRQWARYRHADEMIKERNRK